MNYVALVVATVGLGAIVGGCMTRSERDFAEAKQAYIECVKAKGADACEGEKNVMNATGNVYATASGRPQAVGTLVVPRVN